MPHAASLHPRGAEDLLGPDEIERPLSEYTARVRRAAQALEFEAAAEYRDKLRLLKEMQFGVKRRARALLEASMSSPPRHRRQRLKRSETAHKRR